VLLVAVVFAGLYLFLKLQHDAKPNTPQTANTGPVLPPLPRYRVQIMMYSRSTPPQLYVNKEPSALDGYDGRTATLRLHPGSYEVEADYIDRICTAVVSVTHDMSTEAECHLK
jgi:cell division protein FtsN